MSRDTWGLIKKRKNFYAGIYRSGLTSLICSLIISVFLGGVIIVLYLQQPERDYYATSGVTAPLELKVMMTPNKSSTPLLAPDIVEDEDTKVIPQ